MWSFSVSEFYSYWTFAILKGTVSHDFVLQVFSLIIFPQAPENNISIISIFSKSRCTTGVNAMGGNLAAVSTATGGKFATGIKEHLQ